MDQGGSSREIHTGNIPIMVWRVLDSFVIVLTYEWTIWSARSAFLLAASLSFARD